MPLILAQVGAVVTVLKVGGKPEIKKHLENMGFITGEKVRVVSVNQGNLIVIVKETRVALSRELAQKIQVA